MLNVQIVQPLVPDYRVSFFNALMQDSQYKIQVFASEALPGTQSLRSAPCTNPSVHLNHPCITFFNHRLLWQKGLHLEDRLRAGDVLVVCGNARFLSNYPLIWRAKQRKVATVWWGIGTMPRQNPLNGFLRRQIMRWTDVILLYTEREREEFLRMGFPSDRLFAINNAIDQEPIQEAIKQWSPTRLCEFQQQQGLIGKQVFLFCGRIMQKARVDLAIEALALLVRENQECILVIIGDGEERSNLQELAQRLGVKDSIRWLGALYDQTVMAPWFLSAKLFVYPGYIGLSIMHAMGYGLPVITHHNMSNQSPEVAALREGHNGALFEENSSEDLSRKMLSLIVDEKIRQYMSEQATATATQEFTLKEMVRRFCESVHTAASQSRSRPKIAPSTDIAAG
jgi:glycosyltransferase involved in cell wall biosynthesis